MISILGGGPLHAMDCTDIVIGTARGNQFRVFDYYTRDRSTPRLDEFYNGTQSITGAVGEETNGYTIIKFRKPLISSQFININHHELPIDMLLITLFILNNVINIYLIPQTC